jgi:hypothetical protein
MHTSAPATSQRRTPFSIVPAVALPRFGEAGPSFQLT